MNERTASLDWDGGATTDLKHVCRSFAETWPPPARRAPLGRVKAPAHSCWCIRRGLLREPPTPSWADSGWRSPWTRPLGTPSGFGSPSCARRLGSHAVCKQRRGRPLLPARSLPFAGPASLPAKESRSPSAQRGQERSSSPGPHPREEALPPSALTRDLGHVTSQGPSAGEGPLCWSGSAECGFFSLPKRERGGGVGRSRGASSPVTC